MPFMFMYLDTTKEEFKFFEGFKEMWEDWPWTDAESAYEFLVDVSTCFYLMRDARGC